MNQKRDPILTLTLLVMVIIFAALAIQQPRQRDGQINIVVVTVTRQAQPNPDTGALQTAVANAAQNAMMSPPSTPTATPRPVTIEMLETAVADNPQAQPQQPETAVAPDQVTLEFWLACAAGQEAGRRVSPACPPDAQKLLTGQGR